MPMEVHRHRLPPPGGGGRQTLWGVVNTSKQLRLKRRELTPILERHGLGLRDNIIEDEEPNV